MTARINEGEEIGDGREEAKKKCKICTNIIKKGADHLICTVCKNTIHKKEDCSDVTATGMRTLNRSIWQCRGCIEAETERENRRNRTDHDGEEVEYVMQDGKNMEERELRILQWNADTLSTRKEELRQALKDHKVDIFLVQETKMTKSSKVPKFPGYTIINKPRHQVAGDESNRGGGLLTGIRKTVPYKEIRTNNLRGKDDGITEWQTFEVPMSSSEKMRITNLYIPSERVGDVRGSDKESVVTTTLWPAEVGDMLAGDFNAHAITWDNALELDENHRSLEAKRGEMIEDWIEEKDMACLNDGTPTHTNRATGKESAPDITIVHAHQAEKYDWKVLETLGGSDHKPILITRQAELRKQVNSKVTYKWNLKEANLEQFSQQVEDELPENYERKNTHKLEKILRKTITAAVNQHVKIKEVSMNSKPVLDAELKEKIKERNNLRKNIKSETDGRKKSIEKCREVQEMTRKKKEDTWKEYVESLESSTSSREVWKTIRNLDGRYGTRKDNEVLVVEGKGYVEDKDKAEVFARTYKKESIIPRRRTTDAEIKRQNRKFLKKKPNQFTEWEQAITMEELERVIEEASTGKAAGEDAIPNELLKALGQRAKMFILHLFNRVWQQGEELPQWWRTSIIKPLLKDGKEPEHPESYRPISLTACIGKLLEKIIADRLKDYLENNNLLNPVQAGFRSDRCTEDQILKLVQMATDTIHAKPNGSAATLLTLFDFKRAFDKVWRDGLLSKMIDMELPVRFVKYTRLFLSARKTKVEVNGVKSNEFFLNEGLPQGSSISPILFLIFINDITDYMDKDAASSLFADDTGAWVVAGKDKIDAERRMQAVIDGVSRWAREWKMSLNQTKTESMVISSSREERKWKPILTLNGAQIKIVTEYKFLGVIIDSGLRFKSHVNTIVAKCRRRNNILRCLAGKDWGQCLKTQKSLYLTYIRSAIEYASSAWFPWISETARKRLERVQNESLRIMSRLAKTCPEDFLRLETGTEPLKQCLEKNG